MIPRDVEWMKFKGSVCTMQSFFVKPWSSAMHNRNVQRKPERQGFLLNTVTRFEKTPPTGNIPAMK